MRLSSSNSAGDVAGTAYRPPNQFGLDAGRPFVVHDGTLRLLPLPFGSATDSAVIGENDRGDLVGYAGRGFIEPIAFVDGEWLDLNTASTRPDGYSVFAPLAINNNGQIIASAMGPDLGVDRTFLLTPVPEPGAVGVLALAMGATLRRRRRG